MFPRDADATSEFGCFFISLAERSEMTIFQAALKAGIRSRTRITYAMRRRWNPNGRTALSPGRTALLTEEELIALAGVLMATEDEKQELILLGLKEYMTPRLRDYYERLERQYVAQRVRDQKAPPRIQLRTELPPRNHPRTS